MSTVPARSELSYRANTANGALAGTSISDSNDMGKLWLPIWSGEVLHAYDQYKSFEPMVQSKTISSGRTIEFPITGTVALQPAWSAGEYLSGGDNSAAATFTVALDKRPMAAHFELDNVDLMITQWEYRQELARQAGQTLANARDEQIGAFIAGAAGVAPLTTDPRTGLTLPAPFAVGSGDDAAMALEVLKAIEEFNVDCQENNIQEGVTYCAVTPRLFQQIRRLGVATDASEAVSMQPMFGGVGLAGGLGADLKDAKGAMADSLIYMGVTICKSNHLPTGADTVIGEARYTVDGSAATGADVKGLIWRPEAVASVRKTGLVVDTEDDIRRNTTFTVASMLSGTGIVKPELSMALVGDAAGTAVDRATYLGELESASGQFGYVDSSA